MYPKVNDAKPAMNTDDTQAKPPSRFIFPRWLGAIVCAVGLPLAHGLVPWAISLLTVRHGWVDHRPGVWNLAGLVLVAIGFAAVVWTLTLHFREAPRGWAFEQTPRYLLTRGPYRFSRNPIYLAYAPLWLGWITFYGSMGLLVSCALLWSVANFVLIPHEERNLEARFGEAYREYKRAVPRWLGRVRR
jgi:protein-S-isoprenylcysteine O-methyltransferase Ste14